MIKTVIFDFFGVLQTDGYKSWLTKQGIPLEGEYYDLSRRSDLGLLADNEFFEELSKLSGIEITEEEIDQSTSMYTEVIAIVEKVRETYPTGLLSNAPSGYIREILQEHNLEHLFNTIVVSGEIGFVKPDRRIFEHILGVMNANAKETIFIDDSLLNVEGARAVGINAIHFQSPKQLKEELAALGVDA